MLSLVPRLPLNRSLGRKRRVFADLVGVKDLHRVASTELQSKELLDLLIVPLIILLVLYLQLLKVNLVSHLTGLFLLSEGGGEEVGQGGRWWRRRRRGGRRRRGEEKEGEEVVVEEKEKQRRNV